VAEQRRLQSRRVLRQMDHFIMALAADGTGPVDATAQPPRPGFLLSLYWFDYTIELGEPARTGHVAYAWSDGFDGGAAFETVLTDAPEIAGGLGDRMRPGQWPLADPDRVAKPATFLRRGTQPWGFDFRVTGADGLLIEARWADLSPPVFGTGPARGGGVAIATMLTESMSPSVRVNGRTYPGRRFPNPIWTPWFGSERGSCIIGLGETIYEPLD
jgi:hypothetical protein